MLTSPDIDGQQQNNYASHCLSISTWIILIVIAISLNSPATHDLNNNPVVEALSLSDLVPPTTTQKTDANRKFGDFVAGVGVGTNDDHQREQTENGRRVMSLLADTAGGSGLVEEATDLYLTINSRELKALRRCVANNEPWTMNEVGLKSNLQNSESYFPGDYLELRLANQHFDSLMQCCPLGLTQQDLI